MVYHVYIASKGRPKSRLFEMLKESGVSFTCLIEPQDKAEYGKVLKDENIFVIPKNDQGLYYVRNKTLELARKRGEKWFWVLDDDITMFKIINKNGKPIKVSVKKALEAAENYFNGCDLPIAEIALEYEQFAFRAYKKGHTFNSYCDVITLMRTDLLDGLYYDERLAIKGDRDFTLQIIKNGFYVARLHRVAFSCPSTGGKLGGLYETYKKTQMLKNAVSLMVEKWPSVVTMSVKNGAPEANINWKLFSK